ncbi:MAG TPA: DUF2807 domain-containing protein [Brevundimonas sp.]|uniref:GIN domain-containing protein n=1 Tax=Brevundimonas sp. TaxID=1871086 RepID=UPI002C8CB22B|nr:DUF2807 domain-containing protein [Brevundimonas sp.]HRH21374.1 DUF2807 domain-containing protein [Brevundimonas sp.]
MLKLAHSAIVLGALLASTAVASTASAQEVEIENAVARVVVIPEDRPDIQVTVEPGTSGLPPIQVSRRGDEVRLDGGLRRRIQTCDTRDFVGNPMEMPDGVRVSVRDHGTIEMSQAPLVVIRTPRDVRINASGAIWGAIGRSSSTELAAGGCGDWSVGNTDGELSISVGGSGDVRAGTARSGDFAIGGSGSILAGAIGGATDVAIGGSGSVVLASVGGPADIAVGGSGSVRIEGGQASSLDVAIAGSGDVVFRGTAASLSASIAGSGDVTVTRVTGEVDRAILGSGQLHIGS